MENFSQLLERDESMVSSAVMPRRPQQQQLRPIAAMVLKRLGIVRRFADSRSEWFSTGSAPSVVRPTQVGSTAKCSAVEGAPFRSGSTVAQRPGPGFVQRRVAAAQ